MTYETKKVLRVGVENQTSPTWWIWRMDDPGWNFPAKTSSYSVRDSTVRRVLGYVPLAVLLCKQPPHPIGYSRNISGRLEE